MYYNWRLITLQQCGGFLPYIDMNQPQVTTFFLTSLWEHSVLKLFFCGHLEASRSFSTAPQQFLLTTGGSDGKESSCNIGDAGLIPGSGRSPGGGHGCPLQYSCLENSVERGTWRTSVHGVTNSRSQLNRLSKLSKNPSLLPLLLLISKLERSHPEQTWCIGTVLQ